MKLIKPHYEIWIQKPGLDGIYKQIERVGRVSYKSEDKITENSAKPFVDKLISLGHGAVLEHGTVYLYSLNSDGDLRKYMNNPYSRYKDIYSHKKECQDDVDYYNHEYVTTNYRVLVENNWLDDLKYLCKPTEFHEKRITVYFDCDRVTGESFLRHRVFSFMRESTRYCNYSKDKFGNEITFIIPCWCNELYSGNSYDLELINDYDLKETENLSPDTEKFIKSLVYSEKDYFDLLNNGWQPQQARSILHFSIKSPLVMTGFADDWWGNYIVIDKATGLVDKVIHGKFYAELNNIDREKYRIVEKGFFPLRCSNKAHPQAQELAKPLRQEFIARGYLNE